MLQATAFLQERSVQTGKSVSLPWVQAIPGVPYFQTEDGRPWSPVGQNDAITWPDLANLYHRKDLAQVEAHLQWLAAHGVTCLRLMLEYCQVENRYLENPAGKFQPAIVQLWDDLFRLCEKHGLRILLTPYDTFWMWLRWKYHPYNKKNGGICARRSHWLLCKDTLEAIKGRLTFATERWGGSGALFAWDLWNELHPDHSEKRTDVMYDFVCELSEHLRSVELSLHGRTHPQTVSVYCPQMVKNPEMAEVIFRHPDLDFASTHFYDDATINNPRNTVDSALVTGHLTREALTHIPHDRPFFDSEHGPIHAFKDRRKTCTEAFDDEYFRHMQWAHLASGGAGGGMRWPYRHPHVLTHGMRAAQLALSKFLPLIDWTTFKRKNLNHELRLSNPAVARLCLCRRLAGGLVPAPERHPDAQRPGRQYRSRH